ncbi:gamma-tubulin complex component 5 [Chelonus insularis]|uniref:gamma-tubulin complex component 5 n=1 Tax=Chelonus insularis TaxID=460826 RepID=UPI00158CA00E|nr:gamma-tubulin complex component 5 [Chelonus insularis]
MGTQILNDISRDLKLLITSITGFEPPEEGFRICEKFVVSNVKYHTYLSTNSNTVKKLIKDVKEKFIIHAKYNVAKEFEFLVDTFLGSFNFDQHPQPDLQWSLLYLLLSLSSTDTSSAKTDYCNKNLSLIQKEKTLTSSNSEDNEIDEIDWKEYLQEGQEEFFYDYGENGDSSDSEFTESGDEQDKNKNIHIEDAIDNGKHDKLAANKVKSKKFSDKYYNSLDKFSKIVESQKWLDKNIENGWWLSAVNEKSECTVVSQLPQANLCKIYDQEVLNQYYRVTGLIKEYQACQEILWMFHVPMDMTIYEKIADHFRVRSNISIPSLTPIAFRSICSNYCGLFSAIQELYSFEENLYRSYKTQNVEAFPPLTYDTYYAVVKQYLNRMKRKIISIESQAKQEDDIVTLLTLSQDLKESKKELEMLYGIHKLMNFEKLEKAPNWEKAYRLISSLYREMENSGNVKRTNLCANLYISSLRVYLNIIDTWLSEGRLEDFRDEFLAFKVNDSSKKSENEQNMTSFLIRRVDDGLKPDPIMEKLFKKVEELGRSIELLVTLNRISDMWQLNHEQYSSRIPLNDEFITQVLCELAEYSSSFPSIDETDKNEESESTDSRSESSRSQKLMTGLEDNLQQQILRINNPFLMKVFQDYLPPMNVSMGAVVNVTSIGTMSNAVAIIEDAVDAQTKQNKSPVVADWGIKIFEKLQAISPFILPISKILESVLEKILDRRYSCTSKLVKDILINEYKLEKHLKLMRSIYMMERGHIMKKFYHQMFLEIENQSCSVEPDYLSNILEETLCDEWRDANSSYRWSITLTNNVTCKVLQAVDHTTLHYAVDWPINMILTDQVLSKYNEIFRFQLKLKWALWSLSNLNFIDLESKNSNEMKDLFSHFNVRRLECLRFWLLHAIGSIHTYLSGQVLQSLGMNFEQSITRADDLDSIIQLHNNYLNKVYEHCLQTAQFEDIISTINDLLKMCAHIRKRWERGIKQLMPNDLDLMESNYTKYHTYLALALHNAVQHKEANYLAGLASAFNCSMPTTN